MATTVEIMTAGGIRRPDITTRAAAAAGLDLAAACVVLMAETRGGQMIWGHDGAPTTPRLGIYEFGGAVTRANYLAYRDAMRAGRIKRQGVGDCQLTSSEYQDRGDRLGGCWDPLANQTAGFTGLAALIRRFGDHNGFRAYNGAGAPAERYANDRMAELARWRVLLAGGRAPLAEGDTGPAVAALQRWLNDTFPSYSAIDCGPQRYGPQTVKVLAEFQRRAGITGPDADGTRVGPRTWAALEQMGYRG